MNGSSREGIGMDNISIGIALKRQRERERGEDNVNLGMSKEQTKEKLKWRWWGWSCCFCPWWSWSWGSGCQGDMHDEGQSRKKIRTNNLTDRSHYPTISIHFIQNCWWVWLFPHTPSHTHVIPCVCVSSLHVINGKELPEAAIRCRGYGDSQVSSTKEQLGVSIVEKPASVHVSPTVTHCSPWGIVLRMIRMRLMLLHCWHCCARTGSCHTNANQTMGAEFVHGVLGLKGMGGKTHRTFYPIREVGLKQ